VPSSVQSEEAVKDVVLNAHGNFGRVRELVDGDPALVNARAPWDETPIQAASHMGRKDIAEYLLEQGAPMDVFCAAMLGRGEDVVSFLDATPGLVLQNGVHGMPILFFPATSGQLQITELLVERGADVRQGAGGNTALHAAAYFDHPEVAAWLLEHGADAEAVDHEGKRPIDVAREKGHDRVVAVLNTS
jgi:uncharacterized protein